MTVCKALTLLPVLVCLTSLLLFPQVTVGAAPKTLVVPDTYLSIAAAIGNATDGDTILVKAGTYQEDAIYTNKSLTITGEGIQSTIINLKSQSHTVDYNYDFWGSKYTFYDPAVEVSANNFTMSKLTLTSNGGIISLSGDRIQLVDCSIGSAFRVRSNYLDLERNLFSMSFSMNGSYSTIRGNTFAVVGYEGLSIAGQYNLITDNIGSNVGLQVYACSSYIANNNFNGSSHFFTLSGDNNIVSGNTLSRYAYGLAIDGLNNTILKNTITHCGQALLPRANNTCYANYIATNSWGLDTSGTPLGTGGGGLLYNNDFVDNTYQVNTLFPAKSGFFDNGKVGNYWSDYRGADSNGDGIGDTPYIVDSDRSDRYPLMAPINISTVPDLIPNWAKTPNVQLINPIETSYSAGKVAVDFVVDKHTTSSMYSLDGKNNVTITGNATLPNLPAGTHNITVYSTDSYHTTGASNVTSFTVAWSFLGFSESTSTTSVIIAVAITSAGLVAFLLYRRYRKTV